MHAESQFAASKFKESGRGRHTTRHRRRRRVSSARVHATRTRDNKRTHFWSQRRMTRLLVSAFAQNTYLTTTRRKASAVALHKQLEVRGQRAWPRPCGGCAEDGTVVTHELDFEQVLTRPPPRTTPHVETRREHGRDGRASWANAVTVVSVLPSLPAALFHKNYNQMTTTFYGVSIPIAESPPRTCRPPRADHHPGT